ncbi:type II/IV secretion system protein [Candidatus Saccharibacteria bacterium]|nr:type II/IV secretion system protein [Candidatus Saccharibacteria bacterium]
MDTNDKQAIRFRETDESATQKRAALIGIEYLDTRGISSTAPLLDGVLTIEQMYQGKLVPLKKGGDRDPYVYGVTSDTPQSLTRKLHDDWAEKATNAKFLLISKAGYREFMQRYDPPKEVVYDDVEIAKEGDSETIDAVSKTLDTVRTDDILDYLIDQADSLGASDIHVENQRENVRIRFRVDGALHSVANLTHEKYRILKASLATKANISTASEDAQSGSMQKAVPARADTAEHFLNMRIETVPTVYGQDVVIRLFNFDETLLDLGKIGVNERERAQIDEIVSHPRGMVLMVGPTGSGKSTTLYSMINALNTPDRKIVTLEDPVEFRIPGVSQIPVNTGGGQTFADKLRAVLRLDPDIVMVGEIRDNDTARTTIQAAITGHLVLSTFHAETASAAFSRMIDMIGINPIFSTAIRLVVGQRLVRKLDDNKESYRADEATSKWIREVLSDLPEGIEKPNVDGEITLYKPVISEESPFGYSGRVVLMEQLVVDEEIQKFLRGEIADAHAETIEKVAKQQGMVTMVQSGVLRALAGETTLEEIHRVL